jgi:hypothetical protein
VVKRKGQEANFIPDFTTWLWYFRRIKKVCPWSYKSFIDGTTNSLDIEKLNFFESNWEQEPWEAIIYLVGEDLTLDEIDNIVASKNESQIKCEYLWSHPSFSKGAKNQTHVPVIIQQDRKRLMELRYANAQKRQKENER